MDVAAKVTSKGQVTIPKAVREALAIYEGDEILFRVEGDRAVMARTPELLTLAGTVDVPVARRGAAWRAIRAESRRARAARRR